MKLIIIALIFLIGQTCLHAQSNTTILQDFLENRQEELGLSSSDINSWTITDQHLSKQSNATYIYIQQHYQGIGIHNGLANFAIKDNKVVSMGNRLINNISTKINYQAPKITPTKAIELAAQQLGLSTPKKLKVVTAISSSSFEFNTGSISLENIPIKLQYFANSDTEIRLTWDLSIYSLDAQDWWSVRIDAETGVILDKNNWVTKCQFDHAPFTNCSHQYFKPQQEETVDKMMAPDQYMVYALPLESPSHGNQSLVTNPANLAASPFGWHDTNGAAGAEYTITRGNNVYAYEDSADNNSPGFSPNGGSLLEFNFPINNNTHPTTYLSGAITNLFYVNNMLHDVWYPYGFDEASGNFQSNNYGNGGAANDYVRAEAQDGSGTNNANFATPPDGFTPRMQMYIWTFNSSVGAFFQVNTPSNIAGSYQATKAQFGPMLPGIPVTGELVLIEDNLAPINDGCNNLVNAAALNGKIVLIDQGNCGFTDKIQAAQNAGAIGVIIANTTGFLYPMTGTSTTITIPSIMVLAATANALKSELLSGTVNVSISNAGIVDKDSDLDNGIISHEYGHGISNRLTGGAGNAGCLHNAEQMGEGWSDWFGLMLTIEPGDLGSDVRGIGTYVKGQSNTGAGIRPAPYSTSFSVNNYTYASSNNAAQISEPHGVGFVFATALWDLTWALIDFYGGTPDPDLFNGTGGNNVAMHLVIEGLKLQPCSPGMIDGRDAILQADQLLYGGAHHCLIWEVFRKRGFGYSASQGSAFSRTDQIAAFDNSPTCMVATAPPIAAFVPNSINSCVSTIHFTDSSQSMPHQWLWDFGDGQTSTVQSPSHSYTTDGVYTVSLVVSNNMGNDTTSQQITITLPPAPIAISDEACAGDTAVLVATGTGGIKWLNSNLNFVKYGDTLQVPNLGSQQTYYAQNLVGSAAQFVGVMDSSIGTGGFESSSYHGALNFRADQKLEIVSALVYAQGAGQRTFFLSKGTNTNGSTPTLIVDDASIFLTNGLQRVTLNFVVPDSGDYNLGGSNLGLYKTSTGASYPYTAAGLMTINSSSSSNSDGYYYFYDLEVQEPRCISAADTAFAIPVAVYFTYNNSNNNYTFTDGSVGATSWFWEFGDGNTSTQQHPIHTYAGSGPYTVSLSINNGACTKTQVLNMLVGYNNIEQNSPKVSLIPNPTNAITNLFFDHAIEEDLVVQVIGMDGRIIQTNTIKQGSTQVELDLKSLPSALYLVRVQGLYFSDVLKVEVSH